MGRVGRWFCYFVLATAPVAAGCAFGKKPYTHDPLLDRHRAAWGTGRTERGVAKPSLQEPIPPPPPPGPLIGDLDRLVRTSPSDSL